MITYCIIDDDTASRKMIENIITDCRLGIVIGSATGGEEAIHLILEEKPHVVLIDLLMPEIDGIEMIVELKKRGYNGKFIMISQISNKEMVGEAYKVGIEFFIHKPINSIEVEAVLNRIRMQMTLDRSIVEIRRSLTGLEIMQPEISRDIQRLSVKEIVSQILKDMGILAEKGSKDLVIAMELLINEETTIELPPLKKLYTMIAEHLKEDREDILKEVKAIEQRIRRTVVSALNNIASLGLTDYSHPKFEHFAPLFFDFQDVRLKMQELENNEKRSNVKVNVKKFLQVLYLETLEKIK
ncbi:response regulator [Robertmurraya sp. FSL W8-0741]|uniref:response regulator n=1 Tax=Robertmurraya TaxID=2837507 RepID=UPI0014829E00|nr:response regulator [Robertmurraya siralis]